MIALAPLCVCLCVCTFCQPRKIKLKYKILMTTASWTPGPGPGRPGSFVLGQHFANIRLARLVRPARLVWFGSVGWFNQRYDIMRFASRYIALYICIHINSVHSPTSSLSLSLSCLSVSLCLSAVYVIH